jgi:hypothetical protein
MLFFHLVKRKEKSSSMGQFTGYAFCIISPDWFIYEVIPVKFDYLCKIGSTEPLVLVYLEHFDVGSC